MSAEHSIDAKIKQHLLLLWTEVRSFLREQREIFSENSVRPSICLSVRLSVKRMLCDKMKERLVQIFISHAGKCVKFAAKPRRHFPPYLKHVSALPWEIKNSNFLQMWNKMQTNCIF